MTQEKKSYYYGGGGGGEPSPGKKKYVVEKAIVVQPRFKEPFYRNYDLYETPGPDGKPSEMGPGVGQHSFNKYKSMADFIAAKRKRMKNRYIAQDSYKADDSKSKERVKKIKARLTLLSQITKVAIDFPLDQYFQNTDTETESDNLVGKVNPMGGYPDKYFPIDDDNFAINYEIGDADDAPDDK